jgi:hypothetical protein
MRKGFEQYYRLSKHELTNLWHNCVFVFDTNVLLDLYRYSPETKQELFAVLEKLKHRVWIPHQVALEFHRNRLSTVASSFEPYRKIKSVLDRAREDILNGLAQLSSKHPFIKVETVRHKVDAALKDVIKDLDESAQQHPNQAKRADEDEIRERLTSLFEGRTGNAFEETQLRQIVKEGETRYANKVPPGYMDQKTKEGDDKFGDLIVWKEILAFAVKEGKSIIFVTGDAKADWWEITGNMTTGPRPELRREFHQETGQAFYMYETSSFLKRAGEIVNQERPVKEAAVKEIQDVHRERISTDEALRQAALTQKLDFTRAVEGLRSARVERPWMLDEEIFRKAAATKAAQDADWQRMLEGFAANKEQSDGEWLRVAAAAKAVQEADWLRALEGFAAKKEQSDAEWLRVAAATKAVQEADWLRALEGFAANKEQSDMELLRKAAATSAAQEADLLKNFGGFSTKEASPRKKLHDDSNEPDNEK